MRRTRGRVDAYDKRRRWRVVWASRAYDQGFARGRICPSAREQLHVSQRSIELRGVAVNNLRHVDLDLPHRQLIVFCGVSGSGKTSMALDTLYAEGQRRYIESFSAYTRQFLEQLDKPEAERIDGIPPAIAVTHKNPSRSNRATVGTTTEVNDYLSLLFARVGEVICYQLRPAGAARFARERGRGACGSCRRARG